MYKYWNGVSLEAFIAELQQACAQGVSFEQYLGYILDIDRLLYAQLPHELRYAELSIWMTFECITGILLHTKSANDKKTIFHMTKAIREVVFKQRPNNPKNIRIWPLLEKKHFFDAIKFNKEQHREAQLAHEKRLRTINQHAAPHFQDFLQRLPHVDEKIKAIILRYQVLAQILEEFNNKKLLGRIEDKPSIFHCILSLAAYFTEEGDLMLKEKHVRWTEAYHLALGFYQIALRGQYLGSGFQAYHTRDLNILAKIRAVEDTFIHALGAKEPLSLRDKHRVKLVDIREKTRQAIEPILEGFPENDCAWLERGELLQPEIQQLHEELKGFIGELFTDAMACLGKPPCQFSVIGFGSLEKGSATLYSDVELGILLPENADTDEAREYFRRLTHVLFIEVIRLGETPIPYSTMGIDCDDLLPSGFCFDLGGKTPLGRRELAHDANIPYGELRYELIGAPSRLIQYIEDKYFYIDKLLPIELSRCTHIFGQIEITSLYHALLKQRFNQINSEGMNLYQERARMLLLGKPEFALRGDLDKFFPNLGDINEEGKPFNVKQDLYRLPDRLIDNLAFYFEVIEGNTNEKIKKLQEKEILGLEQVENLYVIDTISMIIRYRTYQHYEAQNEHMPVFAQAKQDAYCLEHLDVLVRFYRTAIPFCHAMRRCTISSKYSFDKIHFIEKGEFLSARIMLRLANYRGAISSLEKVYDDLNLKNNTIENLKFKQVVVRELGYAYYKEGKPEAIPFAKTAVTLAEKLMKLSNQNSFEKRALAISLTNLAVLLGTFNPEETKEAYKKAIELFEELNQDRDNSIIDIDKTTLESNMATVFNNFSCSLRDFEELRGSEKWACRALEIREKLYLKYNDFNSAHNFANSLNNLGDLTHKLGDLIKAKMYHEKAIEIRMKIYSGKHGASSHPDIAQSFNNLGAIFFALGDFEKAKNYHQQALAMRIKFYIANLDVIVSLNNYGLVLKEINIITHAEQCHKKALEIAERTNSVIATAETLNNLGLISENKGNPEEAEKYYKRAIDIFEKSRHNSNWNLAIFYENLAGALHGQKKEELAEEFYKKSLKMFYDLCDLAGVSQHPNLATCLNNVGAFYNDIANVFLAREYYQASLNMQLNLYPLGHPRLEITRQNLKELESAHNNLILRATKKDIHKFMQILTQSKINRDTQASLVIELKPSELYPLTFKQLIEVALQLDRGMYPLLPKRWQNPGMAGLCAFLIVADRLKQAEKRTTESLTPEHTQFLQTIDETCQKALDWLEKEGLKARIKPLMNELFEYAAGFERRTFEESEFVPLKATIKDLPCEGQLVYRVRDKLFFILVEEGFIEKMREHFSTLDRPRAEIGSAHIILNEGMPMEESAKWYEKLCQRYQKTNQYFYSLAKGDSDFIYFDKRISFKVVGAYAGLPKTNSRLRQTLQWHIESEEISQLNKEGLCSHLNDYCYHITFAEEARKPHPIMAKCSSIEDLLDKQSNPMHSHLYNLLMLSSHTQDELMQDARKASREGHDKSAIEYYQKAIEAGERHSKATYLCRIRLAKHWYFDNQTDKASAELDRVYEDIKENTIEAPDLKARYYQWLAKLHYRANHWEDAKGCCFKAKAAWESVQNNAEEKQRLRAIKGMAKVLSDLGNIEAKQGNYQNALQYQLEAQKSIESLPDEQKRSESAAWIDGNLGRAYRAMENNDEALYWLKKAHKLRKIIRGPTHPACAGNLLTIAELHGKQQQWDDAKKQYQKVINLRKTLKGDVDRHLAAAYYGLGMSYLAEFDDDSAILQFKAALAIDEQLNEPSQHAYEHVVRDLIEIAKATFNQGDIEEAQSYCQQAEAMLQTVQQKRGRANLVLKDECDMLAIRIALSQKVNLSKAIDRAQALQERNQRFIEDSQKTSTLSDFDCLDYTPILQLLSDVYILAKKPEEAYWVFLNAVEKWWQRFPYMASLWLKSGLKIAHSNGLDTRLIANAYMFQGKIRYQQECYRAALKSVMKSQRYHPSQEAENDFAIYQQKVKQRLEIMEEDLFHQLEEAKEGYHAVCVQYLCDLEHGTQLSVYAVNRTTEVFIKLRNILDMSYARFIRKAIYEPNQQKGGELYYPMFSSRAALEKRLINQKILFRPQLRISEIQGWLKQKGIINFAFDELKRTGIIIDNNEKFILAECKDDDNCWNKLSIHLDPCLSFLRELITKHNVGDTFGKSELGKAEIGQNKLERYYQTMLPTANRIWERLKEKEMITEIKTNNDHEKLAWLINDNILGQGAMELHCANDSEKDKRCWHAISRTLAEKLQEKVKLPEPIQHVENAKYLKVWEYIIQEQPFAYFAKGYAHSGEMEASWLEKLSGIQNDSKHIRLTPQGVEHRLLTRQSQVKRRDVKVFIHYLDPLIYPWTFAEELHARHALSINKEEAFEISRMLVNWLKEFKYIDQRLVSTSCGLEMIHIARSQGKGQAFEDAKEKFRQALHDNLAKHKSEWLVYGNTIFDILCKKLLQRGYIELSPDKMVEQGQLMNKVIFHVDALANIFGQTLGQHLETSIYPCNDDTDTYWEKCQKPNALETVVLEYRNVNQNRNVNKYLELAETTKENHPWLSYIYYERARDIAIHKEGDYQKALNIATDMAKFSIEQGWHSRTQALLQQAMNYPVSGVLKKGGERCNDVWKSFREEEKTRDEQLDSDLNIQLVHCREMYAILCYNIFGLYQDPENAILLQQIQGVIADLIIKVRHLLDQAMDRFVRTCINNDNDKLISIWGAKYPCTRDEVELKSDFLCLKEQLGKADFEKMQQQLSEKMINENSPFYAVYEYICETQSFNDKHNSWLRRMVNYSNQLKHVKFQAPTVDILKKCREQCLGNFEDFYPILQSGYLVLNNTSEWEPLLPTLRCAINEVETTLHLLFKYVREHEKVIVNQDEVDVKSKGKVNKDSLPPVSHQIKHGFSYTIKKNKGKALKQNECFSDKKDSIDELKQSCVSLFAAKDLALQLALWISKIEFDGVNKNDERHLFGLMRYEVTEESGNCLFASIAAFVPNAKEADMRQRAIDYIQTDTELTERIMAGCDHETLLTTKGNIAYQTLDNYHELMRMPQTWGTQMELLALARELKRPVAILTPNNQYDHIIEENVYRNNEPIFLNYVRQSHYEPLAVPDNKNAMDILNEVRSAIEERNNERERNTQQNSGSSTMAL